MRRVLAMMIVLGFLPGAAVFGQDAGDPRTVAEDAIQPQVTIGDGILAVAYISRGDIHVAISSDNGKTFESVVAMKHGEVRGGKRRGPRVAIDEGGVLHVTSPMPGDGKPNKRGMRKNELFYTQSADNGKTWLDPIRVNTPDGAAAESLHWMDVAPDGVVHVAWMDMRSQSGVQVYYTTIEDGNVGEERMVFKEPCPCCAPGLDVDAKGNPTLAFRDGAQKDRAIQILRSTDGGESFKNPVPANRRPSNVDG
jgi:hypothetical protein